MTRRLLHARAELVAEGIERLGLAEFWDALVVAHARERRVPAADAIADDRRGDVARRDAGASDGGALAGDATRDGIPSDLLDGLSISEITVLYEYSLAWVDRASRKSSGQFFTPDDVAGFLAARARRLDPDDDGMWIDPCCGAGTLSHALAAQQDDPRAFLADRLILVDLDPLALRLAVALLAIDFRLEGDEYRRLRDRARVADALRDDLPEFDFVIMNPPYVVVLRDASFPESADARDLYAYFVERMVTLARRGVVAITPQSFTSGPRFAGLRRFLVRRLAALDVYCFDNVPDTIFRGVKFGSPNSNRANSTRAAVLVGTALGAAGAPATPRLRITPLLRWRAHERAALFASADDFLGELPADAGRAFPKVAAALAPLHRRLLAEPLTVGHLLTREVTPFSLDVPITPRYFLSAVRRDLDRGHVHRLYFRSADDQDRAAVVLNSSLAYWWWRVYDGGITVSRATLASVPVPEPIASGGAPADLIAAIDASEVENVVVKLNAGRANENVKHPWRVLRELNHAVAPEFVDALLATHANSDLGLPSPAGRGPAGSVDPAGAIAARATAGESAPGMDLGSPEAAG